MQHEIAKPRKPVLRLCDWSNAISWLIGYEYFSIGSAPSVPRNVCR
jgi:hypothetical protein